MRGRRDLAMTGAIVALVGAALWGYFSRAPTGAPPSSDPSLAPPRKGDVTVIRVVDGDTVKLSDGETVRYLGIDTPEKGEPFKEEAAKQNEILVLHRPIRWEFGKEPKDSYGRTLAWIFVRGDDGIEKFVNLELVRKGMARVYLHPGNDQHKEELIAAQREAKAAGRGVWTALSPANEEYYVGGTGGSGRYRFHRPGCALIKSLEKQIRIPNRDQAYDEGRSPCRECKP